MILDAQLLFDTAAAITVTRASTNVLDMSVARDMGIGTPLQLLIDVTTTFTAAGSATLQVQLLGSTDNSTYTVYAESDAMAVALLVAGAKLFPISLPHRKTGAALPRYYELNYIVATGPMTAGALTAALVLDRLDAPQYPAGINVAN